MGEPPNQPTDEARLASLATRASRGDRSAAADLLRALQDTIYRFTLTQLADADAAAEATQETGLRLLNAIRRFEGRSRVTTWALGVALNVCREQRRGRRVTNDADAVNAAPAGAAPISAPIEQAEDAQLLHAAIGRLPPRQREAVALRYLEGLSVDQTAEAMGCSAGAVKASVWQALRRLREQIQPKSAEVDP